MERDNKAPVNENNSNNVVSLKAIMDIRGKLLDEFYKDMKHTAERVKTHEPGNKVSVPLKEFKLVRPNKVEIVPVEKKVQPLNSTFTIALNSNAAGKSPVKNRQNLNKTATAIQPVVKPMHMQRQVDSSKIPRFKSNYSPMKVDKSGKQTKIDLNELRERIIKRKFAYLWLRKVHGRVLPSEIDKFKKLSFIREYFNTWKNQWWFKSREWRLNVKAECFYNYNLYKNVWNQWSAFVIASRRENRKLQSAISYHSRMEKIYYFKIWKQFSRDFKIRKAGFEKASEENNKAVMRFFYSKWQHSMTLHSKQIKLEDIAVKHFNFMQLTKVYTVWKYKYLNEIDDRRKQRQAASYYKKTMLQKCLHALVIYTKYRHKKDLQKAKVDEYYESQLVYRLYQKWKQKLELKAKEKEKSKQIEEIQKRMLVIHYFENWKHAYHYKLYLAQKEQQSSKFYQRKLKSKVFKSLLTNYRMESAEKMNELRAVQFNQFWIQKHFYHAWQSKCEEKEDIKLMHLYYKGRKFRENFLMKAYFLKWKDKLETNNDFNNEFSKVDHYHSQKLHQKYFQAMKTYVVQTKYKRENYVKAVKQHEFTVFYSVFLKWYERYKESVDERMNQRIAILHNESKLQLNVFNVWKLKTQFKLYEESKAAEMNVYYENRLKVRYYREWRSHIREIQHEESNETKADAFHFRAVCAAPFRHWKIYLIEGRKLKEKIARAENHYNLKISRVLFLNWRVYAKDFHVKVLQAKKNFDQKMHEIKREYFDEWREFSRESKEERYKDQVAVTLHLRNLVRKIFNVWNAYATNRAVKKFHDQSLIDEFQQGVQLKLVMSVYFRKWKSKKDVVIVENSANDLAKAHYERKMFKKIIDHWIVYTKISKRKKLMEEQAGWFNERRLKFYAFNVWHQEYLKVVAENELNNRAIIHWAWQLEKKCFVNWLLYVNSRKIKKQRYDEAINDRHHEIIKSSIKRLLVFSNDSRERRLKQLVNQKQEQLTVENKLALKYYLRWKEVYKKNKQKKSKISVLFEKVDDFERRIITSNYLPSPVTGKQTPVLQTFTDVPTIRVTTRPQPRKPAFLWESLNKDVTAVNEASVSPDKTKNSSILSMVMASKKPDETRSSSIKSLKPNSRPETPVVLAEVKNDVKSGPKPVLLPPSAFTVLPEAKIVNLENAISLAKTPQSRSSSVTTTFDTEIHQELAILRLNDENYMKKNEESYNLIKLKERLENLTIKKEKLKQLKEQESLLDKCTNSAETKNISLSETLYQELDQLRNEIRNLQSFLKTEKKELFVLLKQYRLA